MLPFNPVVGSVLEFEFEIPGEHSSFHVNLVDESEGNILLHLDFRHSNNLISVNSQSRGEWQGELHIEYPYDQKSYQCSLEFAQEHAYLRINNEVTVIDFRGADLSHVSGIDTVGPISFRLNSADKGGIRRLWVFQRRPYSAKKMQLREDRFFKPQRRGLSALVFCHGKQPADCNFVARLSMAVDEILFILPSSSPLLPVIRKLQLRHFNVRWALFDGFSSRIAGETEENAASTVKEAITFAFTQQAFRNSIPLMAGQGEGQIDDLLALIGRHALRSRGDNFVLVNREKQCVLAYATGSHFGLKRLAWRVEFDLGVLSKCRILYESHFFPRDAEPFIHFESPPLSASNKRITRPFSPDIIEHSSSVRSKAPLMPDLAIFVVSCEKYRHKQEAIRKSWKSDFDELGIPVFFVEGNPLIPATEIGDRLIVDVPDTYEFLPLKVTSAFVHLWRSYGFSHIMKIDDDCYLNAERLMATPFEKYDYLGTWINKGDRAAADWHYGASFNKQLDDTFVDIDPTMSWYDGQGSYILSAKAVEILEAESLDCQHHLYEDYATGLVLRKSGIMADRKEPKFNSGRVHWINKSNWERYAVVGDVPDDIEMADIGETVAEQRWKSADKFLDSFRVRWDD